MFFIKNFTAIFFAILFAFALLFTFSVVSQKEQKKQNPANAEKNIKNTEEFSTSIITSTEQVNIGFEEVFTTANTADGDGEAYYIYFRDKTTNVMYVWRDTGKTHNVGGFSYWGTGFTVMFDPYTGLPLTYEKFCELTGIVG